MNTMKETEEELIQEFEMFDDWMDKYNYIIELGKELPMIDPQYKTEDFERRQTLFLCRQRCHHHERHSQFAGQSPVWAHAARNPRQ